MVPCLTSAFSLVAHDLLQICAASVSCHNAVHTVCDNAGVDAAKDELGELWRLQHGLAEDQACLRLHQVLEIYTDVTRFPP